MNKALVLLLVFIAESAAAGSAFAQDSIPLSLEDAIASGLKNNPVMHASQEKINAARGRFWSGISLPAPELSLNYEYVPHGAGLGRAGEKTYGLNQALEFPMVYFLRGSKFRKETSAAESESEGMRMSVVADVKSAYLTALFYRAQLRIAEENLAIMDDFSKKAGIRHAVGEGTNLERLTAQVQRAEALNAREVQRNHLGTAHAKLHEVLGVGQGDRRRFELTDTLGFRRFDLALGQLLDARSDVNPVVKAQALRAEIVGIDETLAWSELLPKIDLGYSRQTLDGDNGFYGASLGISLPLWFMFDQKGKIEEARANRSIAESELRQARNAARFGIQKAFAEFRNEETRVLLYQTEILPQSEEMYRTAARSYEAGEITYLEFLQARQTIIGSKSTYVDALLAYNLAIIALEEAIGYRLQ